MDNMIEPIKARKCTEPDVYEKSAVWISLVSEDGKFSLGSMQRCGVTPPGYPDRATYKRVRHNETEIFVYDSGYFWNSKEWHQFYRDNRKPPRGVSMPIPTLKPVEIKRRYAYTRFTQLPSEYATSYWQVRREIGGMIVGYIKYFLPWHQYCFFPLPQMVLSAQMLDEIGVFCSDLGHIKVAVSKPLENET